MGFLAPWFLVGAAAVGLPIWLHLLKKHKATPLPFSSLMFFERRTQSSIKHRRLMYLLLLALRTAFILLLVLAFAHPFLMQRGAGAWQGRKLVVVAVDNSFSMRQGSRLDRAKTEADGIIAALRSEDRGQVLAFNANVRMMSDAVNDPSVLRAGVRAIAPSDARGSYAELTRALRSIAQTARTPVEAHVFTDLQKSSLPSNFADMRLGEGIRLVVHPLAEKRIPNFAVESVKAPRRVYDARKARVQATIVGFGAEAATRRVALVLDGKEIDSKTVEVPAGGRSAVEFTSLEAPHGRNRGEVRIDSGDSFPDDDRFVYSIERTDARPALFVYEPRNPRSLLYFRNALESATEAAFRLESAEIDRIPQAALSQYAFVVLSDVSAIPQNFETELRDYVRGGGALLIALGRTAALRQRVPVFDQNIVETLYFSRQGDRFQTAAWLDPAHPSVGLTKRWDDVKFYQAIRVQPGGARVAARLSDDTPLLLDQKMGEGRVLVFASTFDNIANDFPLHTAFVPFIDQTAQYLGRVDDRPSNFNVGSYFELRGTRDQGKTVEVLDPRGERALSLDEATRAQNIQLSSAGFYDVRWPTGRHELIAVNADRQESDFDLVPAETLALWHNTAQASNATEGAQPSERKPFDFWWYVMAAVLAMAVAESLLGNRHLSIDKEAA